MYQKQAWENEPATTSPMIAARLNHMETQYDEAIADAQTYTDDQLAEQIASITRASLGLGNVDNTSDEQQPRLIRGKPNTSYRFIAGTIRRVDATTWMVLNDTDHAPTGIASVTRQTSPFCLRITYDFTASKVGTLVPAFDEAFAAVGNTPLRVGPSVGLTYADLFFYQGTSTTAIDPGTLSTANANVWLWGVHEVAS